MATVDRVDYDTLDRVKLACISASRKTLRFAERFGFVADEQLGASANLFVLDLAPFLQGGEKRLFMTLLPEGLGTADDARPDDLNREEEYEFWWNIGIKTIGALTNDAASSGLQTILLGLYLPSATPERVFSQELLDGFLHGIVHGCQRVGCVYLSGETPQLKSKMIEDRLDIAGALCAILPPGREPIASGSLAPGDSIVLVESSGPHENGFTTLRKLAGELPAGYRTKLPSGMEYWRAINKASHLYTPLVQRILEGGITLTNIENITGHGWLKLMRSKQPYRYRISTMLPPGELFTAVQEWLGMSAGEMLRIFNYGAGLALFTPSSKDAQKIVELAANEGLKAVVAGRVEEAENREVVVEPLSVILKSDEFALRK